MAMLLGLNIYVLVHRLHNRAELLVLILQQQPLMHYKSIWQGRTCELDSLSLISSCPTLKEFGVFRNRIVLASSGMQTTAVARTFVVCGVLVITKASN